MSTSDSPSSADDAVPVWSASDDASVPVMKIRIAQRRLSQSGGRISQPGSTYAGDTVHPTSSPSAAQGRRWLTGKDIAGHLGTTESWVMDRAREGVLPSHKVGHYRFFLLEEVEDAILAL